MTLQDTKVTSHDRKRKQDSNMALSNTLNYLPVIDSPPSPFCMPLDEHFFLWKNTEARNKAEENRIRRGLHVHEKSTIASKLNTNVPNIRKIVAPDSCDEMESLSILDASELIVDICRGSEVHKDQGLLEYVRKKKEMFLREYSLCMKQEKIYLLDKLAAEEEIKVEQAELMLEEHAVMLNKFLEDSEKKFIEEAKKAEAETKLKIDKGIEIRKNIEIVMALKSDISKHQESLQEYMRCKHFLEKVTPNECGEKRSLARKKQMLQKKEFRNSSKPRQEGDYRRRSLDTTSITMKNKSSKRKSSVSIGKKQNLLVIESDKEINFNSDLDEESEIYFPDPVEILNILHKLEERNITLISNFQETEEALEEIKQNIKLAREKMNREATILKSELTMIKSTIQRVEEAADELEWKCKMSSYGEFNSADQDTSLLRLTKRVEEVYRNSVDAEEGSIDSLQMLTSLENKIHSLIEKAESIPSEVLDIQKKGKQKDRRRRVREDKLAAQKALQEERLKKTLLRVREGPKIKFGRRLMCRSMPPRPKLTDKSKRKNGSSKEDEDRNYFFN